MMHYSLDSHRHKVNTWDEKRGCLQTWLDANNVWAAGRAECQARHRPYGSCDRPSGVLLFVHRPYEGSLVANVPELTISLVIYSAMPRVTTGTVTTREPMIAINTKSNYYYCLFIYFKSCFLGYAFGRVFKFSCQRSGSYLRREIIEHNETINNTVGIN